MDTPFYCNMNALTSAQRARHAQLAQQLHPQIVEWTDLPTGYAARIAPLPDHAVAIAEFVTLERRCCPFLELAIRFAPDGGPISLEISGPPGAKPFIRAEFGIPD